MNGIPWWYFHALPGPLEGRRLPRIDPDDVLWRAVGPERAIGGVVYAASAVTAPGVIDVEQPRSRVVFGEPDGRLSDRAEALAALLRAGGIVGEVSPDIRTEIWNKLISNLAGGTLAVLGGAAPRDVYAEPVCATAGEHVMEEAAAIAEALGSRPQPQLRAAHRQHARHGPQAEHPAGPGTRPDHGDRRHVRRAAGVGAAGGGHGADAGTAGRAGEGAGARRGAVRRMNDR